MRETQTSVEKKLRFFIYQGTGLDDYLTKLSNEQSYGHAPRRAGNGRLFGLIRRAHALSCRRAGDPQRL